MTVNLVLILEYCNKIFRLYFFFLCIEIVFACSLKLQCPNRIHVLSQWSLFLRTTWHLYKNYPVNGVGHSVIHFLKTYRPTCVFMNEPTPVGNNFLKIHKCGVFWLFTTIFTESCFFIWLYSHREASKELTLHFRSITLKHVLNGNNVYIIIWEYCQ